MSAKIFPLADVLSFRRESAETSGRYAAMSDAQLTIEAMKRARVELIDDASISAIEMSEAQQRMNRSLERAQALKEEIEARGRPDVSEPYHGHEDSAHEADEQKTPKPPEREHGDSGPLCGLCNGGRMTWCAMCLQWTSTCCQEYGTCQCS
jgi:hypothetical protein